MRRLNSSDENSLLLLFLRIIFTLQLLMCFKTCSQMRDVASGTAELWNHLRFQSYGKVLVVVGSCLFTFGGSFSSSQTVSLLSVSEVCISVLGGCRPHIEQCLWHCSAPKLWFHPVGCSAGHLQSTSSLEWTLGLV